jgi:hypothetical protein
VFEGLVSTHATREWLVNGEDMKVTILVASYD